ncbi:tetratricopeptide repeat-containing sensor histidine kinase [Sunxiuqinia sp. sy24]|uniref:tetratricopeptide repeat-containing sensor histidine kinase n=1 Tax=Sunxiuqinia sp. sy24 TaxID=3461495 RepID=UPI004046696C
MSKLFLFLTFFLAGIHASADNQNQLWQQIQRSKHDTSRFRLFTELAEYYDKLPLPDSAIFYSQKALQTGRNIQPKKSKKSKHNLLLSRSYRVLGFSFFMQYKLDSTYHHFHQVEQIARQELSQKDNKYQKRYQQFLAESLRNMGVINYLKGNLDQSTQLYLEAIPISEALQDTSELANSYSKLGLTYKKQGKLAEALQYFYESLHYYELLNKPKETAVAFLNIATIHYDQNNHEEAIEGYKRTLQLFKAQGDEKGMAICLSNIGKSYLQLENFDLALKYAQEALEVNQKRNDKVGIAINYGSIALLYEDMGKYEQAESYYKKTLTLKQKLNDIPGLINVYGNLASVHVNLAKTSTSSALRESHLNRAIAYGHKSRQLSPNFNAPFQQKAVAKALREAYAQKGDYKKALEFATEIIELNDTIFNKSKAEAVAEAEAKYETSRKEQQIELQKTQLAQKEILLSKERLWRNSAIVAFSLTLLILILIYYNYNQHKKNNRILKLKNQLIEEQRKEIQKQMDKQCKTNKRLNELVLFKEKITGMIVHDLKSPLNGIINSGYIDDEELRSELVIHSGYEMLNLVDNMLNVYKADSTEMKVNPRKNDLYQLVENEKTGLLFLLNEKELSLKIEDITRPVFFADNHLIKRVIANLLSNAVKFSPQKGTITLRIEQLGETDIRIGIRNQGPHIPEEKQHLIFEEFGQHDLRQLGVTASTGLGLTFCQLAIKAHGGTLGVNSSEGSETEFWFRLPNSVVEEEIEKSIENN